MNSTILNYELPLSLIDPRGLHGLGANQIDQFDRKKILKWKYKWRDNLRSILKESGRRTLARNGALGRNLNSSADLEINDLENDPSYDISYEDGPDPTVGTVKGRKSETRCYLYKSHIEINS